jgi:hypothetical protein
VPTWPRRQARPTLSLITTPTWQPHAGERLAEPRAARIRIFRQHQDDLARLAGNVRAIHPGIGHHQAQAMAGDDQIVAHAEHFAALRQHDLDQARVLAGALGQAPCLVRRLHRVEPDQAGFCLRDDLLRHHQDVAVDQREPGADQRILDQPCQVVTRLHQRDAGQRYRLETREGDAFWQVAATRHPAAR